MSEKSDTYVDMSAKSDTLFACENTSCNLMQPVSGARTRNAIVVTDIPQCLRQLLGLKYLSQPPCLPPCRDFSQPDNLNCAALRVSVFRWPHDATCQICVAGFASLGPSCDCETSPQGRSLRFVPQAAECVLDGLAAKLAANCTA